jgi:Flp pilus assembly pilin Flp
MSSARSFFYDDAGATAVEYALLFGLIALIIIKGAMVTGIKASAVFG